MRYAGVAIEGVARLTRARRTPMRVYAKGDRVAQAQYGAGTVTDANEHHTVIDFDAHGLRRFATRLVRLEPSSEPAPAGKPAARRTTRTAKAKKAT